MKSLLFQSTFIQYYIHIVAFFKKKIHLKQKPEHYIIDLAHHKNYFIGK